LTLKVRSTSVHRCVNVSNLFVRSCSFFLVTLPARASFFVLFVSLANTTGTHSVHTQHKGSEIMFHVSTLLQYYPSDAQQVRPNIICAFVRPRVRVRVRLCTFHFGL